MTKCGCKIEFRKIHKLDPGIHVIMQCPLHAAAEDMLDAMKVILSIAECNRFNVESANEIRSLAEQTITRAGKEGTK